MAWRQSQTPMLMPMPMPHARWRRRTIASTLAIPMACLWSSVSVFGLHCLRCLTFYIHAPRAAAAAATSMVSRFMQLQTSAKAAAVEAALLGLVFFC